MVVEEKKANKESASETAGFEPQAWSVKAHGWCLGPILGLTHNPILQDYNLILSASILGCIHSGLCC